MNVSTLSELYKADTTSVRCYHGINHIADLFHELKVAGDSIKIEDEESLHNAIWMHDVDRTSAVRSAIVAYEAALKDGYDDVFAEKVMHLVLVTQHDQKRYPPTTTDPLLSKLAFQIKGGQWMGAIGGGNCVRLDLGSARTKTN